MSEIDDYNAEAQKLEDALNAAESEFMWKVYRWGHERQLQVCGLDDCDDTDTERELSYFPITAKSKTWYPGGRRMMNLQIERIIVAEAIGDIVSALISVTTEEVGRAIEACQ